MTVFASAVLLACSGSEQSIVIDDEDGPVPTPVEAERALNEALQSFNEYCITATESSYPVTIVNRNRGESSYQFRKLSALTEAGLLDSTLVQTDGNLPVHRFSLTQKGRETQFDIAQGRGYKSRFCYAVPAVARLDSIKSVYNSGPNPLARIWFTYEYKDRKRWSESPAIQRTFSSLPSVPSSQEKQAAKELLTRIDTTWVDRRLTGFERRPDRSQPPSND